MPDTRSQLLEPVLSTEAIRTADRRTIGEYGIPGSELMENAGCGACDVIEMKFGKMRGRDVIVVAGQGNNGGDGLVVARILGTRGAVVTVVTLATEENATPDTSENLRALSDAVGVNVVHVDSVEDIRGLDQPDLIVDALLGIGVTGALRVPIDGLAAWINDQGIPVCAMDVPTGLDSDSGNAAANAVRATVTVAMGALKIGLLLNKGPTYAGEIDLVEIGIPEHVIREASASFRATDAWVSATLPRRPHNAHKYSAGRVVAVVGSRTFTGAATLATSAAYRLGAGAVVCCTPESAQPIIDANVPEVMVAAQEETSNGSLAIVAYDDIVARLALADCVLLGCGLGKAHETSRLVQALLRRIDVPVVLDADGLNAMAGHTELIAELSNERFVLTPHLGEFKRLLGREDLETDDRLELVRSYATEWNAVIVLKGMPSVVGTPDGSAFIGPPGNPSLATAGTGDVLAGSIAGLLAQGLAPADAALCALHVGTAAAERYSSTRGASSMMAGDLLSAMPYVLHERFSG